MEKINKSEEEWRQQLDAETYRVLREKGTERPFTGNFYLHDESGLYRCAGCDAELFSSETKFDSGCGWPSFSEPIKSDAVKEIADHSFGMKRIEVVCAACEGHLGHVFPDGPGPNGLRYCINSVSLGFKSKTSS